MKLSIPSFAKINLTLRVVGKLADGYHELRTVFQTIELHDSLDFEFHSSVRRSIKLAIEGADLPLDERNLIHRAASEFLDAAKFEADIRVSVRKQIPVEAGLGGGSSNAGATLVALSRLSGWPLPRTELDAIAASLGADVPFFLHGGTVYGAGRGDLISEWPDAPPANVLMVHPPVACSTADIYRKFDEERLLTASRDSINILMDLRPESLRDLSSQLENDLERVVFALHPELDSTKKALLSAGAFAAAMAGSGSVVFGLFSDAENLNKAAGAFPGYRCYRSRFVPRREYASALGLQTGKQQQ